jgi:SAM-dependent methyltransferase
MLAPRVLPQKYIEWNHLHGAPFGFRSPGSFKNKLLRKVGLIDKVYSWDPFGFQNNSTTRSFEYPWAFSELESLNKDVLEIGGGLSGLQFVLSRAGGNVVNVDPGQPELRSSWQYNQNKFAELNLRFGTKVKLIPSKIDHAGFKDESFDSAYCVSVLEHLPLDEVTTIMTHVWRCLKPGGVFVLTVDLFLNLIPFCSRLSNEFGSNMNIKWLLDQAPFLIHKGKKSELYGFDEFSAEKVLSQLEAYLMGVGYPVLTQCLVLKK